MSNKFDKLVQEALDNVRGDRKLAREFLNEIANQISNNPEMNRVLSPVAAKHIETLQRSNEQLVKLISIKQKDNEEEKGFSLSDKDELFDMINKEGNSSSE